MTESSTSIQVRWKPPLNSVQSELSYQLNYTNGDIYNTRNTYHKFDGLNPHTEYKIWVRTELNGKEGMMSEPAVGIVETFKEGIHHTCCHLFYSVCSESHTQELCV